MKSIYIKTLFLFLVILSIDLFAQEREATYEDKESAKIHFEAAKKLYKSGKYVEALELFKKAYSRYPKPEILYNIGKCYDKLGDYHNAIKYYEQYIMLNPQAEDKEEVMELIKNLKEAIKRPEKTKVSSNLEDKRKRDKIIGYSLASGGLVFIALGPIFYLKSDSIFEDVKNKNYDKKTKAEKIDEIHFYDNLSLVSYITGGILLCSSAYFLYKGYYSNKHLTITPFKDGFYLTFSGEF